MRQSDLELRNQTYALFVELGRAPSPGEAARRSGLTGDEVTRGWRRLHDAHALVLASDGTQLRMLNPFSAVRTAHRVRAAGRWWYANCAWDAFGICAALRVDGVVVTSCPDCREPITVGVHGERPGDEGLWFHCRVPAARWWDDIVFT